MLTRERPANGGFPEPPASEPQRLVRVRHAGCGAETRVRLPRAVPARAVRRVVCERCETRYECEEVEELGAAGRLWRLASLAIAAAAVVGALLLIQGGGSDTPATGAGGMERRALTQARFVTEPGFTLALPPGWERVPAEGGAAFAARAVGGGGEATLWIERDPDLSLEEFEARSLAQLETLAGTAEVVERIDAPTAEGTVVRLRADAPPESGVSAPYDVTLRAAGPYRHYLATSISPGASLRAREGAELIHASFVPEVDAGSGVETAPAVGGEAP